MKWFRREKPRPSPEALAEAAKLDLLRPRVERAARESDRLLTENNFAARIRAVYERREA